jgi:hypothetical protein
VTQIQEWTFLSQYDSRSCTAEGRRKGCSSDVADFVRRLVKLNQKQQLGGGEEGVLEIKRHPFFNVISSPYMVLY